jgi:hypothetical protein
LQLAAGAGRRVGHDGRAMSAVAAGLWFEDRLISAAEAGVGVEPVA